MNARSARSIFECVIVVCCSPILVDLRWVANKTLQRCSGAPSEVSSVKSDNLVPENFGVRAISHSKVSQKAVKARGAQITLGCVCCDGFIKVTEMSWLVTLRGPMLWIVMPNMSMRCWRCTETSGMVPMQDMTLCLITAAATNLCLCLRKTQRSCSAVGLDTSAWVWTCQYSHLYIVDTLKFVFSPRDSQFFGAIFPATELEIQSAKSQTTKYVGDPIPPIFDALPESTSEACRFRTWYRNDTNLCWSLYNLVENDLGM